MTKIDKKYNRKVKNITEDFIEELKDIKYPEFIHKRYSIKNSFGVDKEMSNLEMFIYIYNAIKDLDTKVKELTMKSFRFLMDNQVNLGEFAHCTDVNPFESNHAERGNNFIVMAALLIKMIGKNKAMKFIRKHRDYEKRHGLMDFVILTSKSRPSRYTELIDMTNVEFTKLPKDQNTSKKYFSENKILYYIYNLGYSLFNNVLTVCENKEIELHTILVNLPSKINRRNLDENGVVKESFKKELMTLFKHSNKLSASKMIRVLQFINYEYIRKGTNIGWRDKEAYMDAVVFARNSSGKYEEIFKKISYTEGNMKGIINKDKDSNEIYFSKKRIDIITIGEKTGCCFTLGGKARSLVVTCLNSNIAGIFKGEFKKSPWFAFVWEIGIKRGNIMETHLILDNIEVLGKKVDNEFIKGHIYKYIHENTMYNKAYIGTGYSKIEDDVFKGVEIIKRPYRMTLFEDEFVSYFNQDDSYNLYPAYDREIYDGKEIPAVDKKELELKELTDPSDIERALYILKINHSEEYDEFKLTRLVKNNDLKVKVYTDENCLNFDLTRYSFDFFNKETGELEEKLSKGDIE